MKYVIKGGIMAAIAFMVIVAAMIISGRSVRKNELENTLEHATKQTVEYLKKNPQIDRQEFVQYFKNNLEMGIESDSEIQKREFYQYMQKEIFKIVLEKRKK